MLCIIVHEQNEQNRGDYKANVYKINQYKWGRQSYNKLIWLGPKLLNFLLQLYYELIGEVSFFMQQIVTHHYILAFQDSL